MITRNMFLAAAPYFQHRFADNDKILASFQSSITSVSMVANLSAIVILGMMQSNARYLLRICFSLGLSGLVFVLLAISTRTFNDISSTTYLAFTLAMVFLAAMATGFCQNGTFAYASSFGRPEYIQANMVGQAVAGVLPSIAQIIAVLVVGTDEPSTEQEFERQQASPLSGAKRSAFIYFMAAALISILTLLCLYPLLREQQQASYETQQASTASRAYHQQGRKVVSMWTLYRKLYLIAGSVFLCFAVTMFFPVFTARIVSNTPPKDAPFFLQPQIFIPLGFLIWNTGDLTGRLATSLPFSLRHRPHLLFMIATCRIAFIPMYLLCNIDGKGAVVHSDLFYLVIVQFGFGLTNGWLGSSCMMAAGEWVDETEREATGGFMATNLVAGLTAGSLLSFTASKA